MMKKTIIAIILLFAFIASVFVIAANADAGDFAGDIDFGDWGDDDWGGDWGDDDWGGGGCDDDDDDDYYYHNDYNNNNNSSDGKSDGSGSSGSGIVFLIVVGIIIFIFIRKSRKGYKKSGSYQTTDQNDYRNNGRGMDVGDRSTPQSELTPMSEYRNIDPDFSEDDIKAKASNIYVQMQNNWTKKDFSPMRPYFTDALYTQFERQLQQKIDQKVTPHIDRISVQNVTLRGFMQKGDGLDHIIIKLETRITVYTTKDDTGEIISGSQSQEKFMVYEWDITRTTGMKTVKDSHEGLDRSVCPSCGAPIDINASARCEYCGSVLSSSEHDWVISRITALSQRTV